MQTARIRLIITPRVRANERRMERVSECAPQRALHTHIQYMYTREVRAFVHLFAGRSFAFTCESSCRATVGDLSSSHYMHVVNAALNKET
jgi:hypothetical protein